MLKLYIFGNNHGRDTESRQLSNITTQSENHGNHGDPEFVIMNSHIPTFRSHINPQPTALCSVGCGLMC